MKPQHQRILEALQRGIPLQGKDRDCVIRWVEPRARRAAAKAERKAKVKANPVLAAEDRQKADHEHFFKLADDNFSILVRTLGTVKRGLDRSGPCCTCGKTKHFKELQAGHWLRRKKFGVRWDLRNVHPQCPYCNDPKRGNGKEPEHEQYIRDRYGSQTPDMLRATAKFNPRIPSDRELAAMATDFMNRAIRFGYTPEVGE